MATVMGDQTNDSVG